MTDKAITTPMAQERRKQKRILIMEVIILAAVILAVILSQTIGTTTTNIKPGEWKSDADLAGKTVGYAEGSDYEAVSKERFPDSEYYPVSDAALLPDLLSEGTIDAFLASPEDRPAVTESYPDICSMFDMEGDSNTPEFMDSRADTPYTMVRRSDYAYNVMEEDTELLNKKGVKIAGITGSELINLSEQLYPDAQMMNYNNFADMFAALEAGKTDVAAAYLTQIEMTADNYPDIAYSETSFGTPHYGFGTAKNEKGEKLLDQFNTFLREIKSSGEYQSLFEKWTDAPKDGDFHLDFKFTGENGTLNIATNGLWFPMTFYSEDELTGLFTEVTDMFCVEYGYIPKYECVDYPTGVAGISSGTYDLMVDGIYITPERLKQLNITDPVAASDMYFVFKKAPETVTASKFSVFIDRIKSGFTTNFVTESRYKMFLKGLLNTLLLALCSCIAGTVLGALICRLRMSRNSFATAFARLYIKIIQGIPILVTLMVLYYIVFSNSGISALVICIIGFSLDFAAYSSEIFRNGIEAVPAGQARAARALGFSRTKAFTKVVLPQALTHIIPVYSGQLVAMVKLTSVAGYISVLDLTKVSDIIRSRTFDAFFPLFTAALIYFILSNILVTLIRLASSSLNKPSRKLRGIDTAGSAERSRTPKAAASGESEILAVNHLKKSFYNVTPLEDVSFKVKKGDVISIIGPSGTGKSTLLNLINRLETPDSGEIIFEGENTCSAKYNINMLRRRVGMVFQSFNLFAHLSIVENIMLAQTALLRRSRQEAYDRSMELLETVGLASKARSLPSELSGGQMQRVAIARAVAMDPEIILFDEPTSALDPTMVGEVLSVIRNLAKNGTTMLIVTHEMKFARNVSTRVFYMDEGLVYEEGSPEEIFTEPKKEKTRQFINRLKVYSCRFSEEDKDHLRLISGADDFAIKQMLPGRLRNRLMAVVEELCLNTIASKYADCEFSFEYSQDREDISFTVSYPGKKKDLLEEMDKLSEKIVMNAVKEISYSYEEEINLIRGSI